jgi:LysM repeat protein
MTTQQYDANGFLVSVTDPSRAEGNRTFVNDGAGRALLVNQGGRVQRQLIVNGEVLGIYGVGLDPTAIGQVGGNASFANVADFNFGYSKVTGAYPSATPGAYHVRPGDTLQSIAQSAYGDSKLWYRIADANGLASSSDLKVGQTLNIPSGVGTISNNAGTFKPYDASRITGDLNPLALPPAGRDADCGGMGKLVMVAVAVAVTVMTGLPNGAVNTFWALTLESACTAAAATGHTLAASAIATAATSAAIGSITSQLLGMAVGSVEKFDWRSVAMSAIGNSVSQGMGGLKPMVADQLSRAAVVNAVTQGMGVVTGLQRRFDWRGVAASYVGVAAAQATESAMNIAEAFSTSSTLKGVTAGLAASIVRGGRVEVEQVATDAFGASLGTRFAEMTLEYGAASDSDTAWTRDVERRRSEINPSGLPTHSPWDPSLWARDVERRRLEANPFGLQMSAQDTADAGRISALQIASQNAGEALSAGEPHIVKAGDVAAHLTLPALIGKLAGAPIERVKRWAAFDQLMDQMDTRDATQLGGRYARSLVLPFLASREAGSAGKDVQEQVHALNGFTFLANSAFAVQLALKYPENDAIIGYALHFGKDAVFHVIRGDKTVKAPEGHAWWGSNPDYPTSEKMRLAAGVTMAIYEAAGHPLSSDAKATIYRRVDQITGEAMRMARSEMAAWEEANPPVEGVQRVPLYSEARLVEHYWRYLGGEAAGAFIPRVRIDPLPGFLLRGRITEATSQSQGLSFLRPEFGDAATSMIREARDALPLVSREYNRFFSQQGAKPLHDQMLYDPPAPTYKFPSTTQAIREFVNWFRRAPAGTRL